MSFFFSSSGKCHYGLGVAGGTLLTERWMMEMVMRYIAMEEKREQRETRQVEMD